VIPAAAVARASKAPPAAAPTNTRFSSHATPRCPLWLPASPPLPNPSAPSWPPPPPPLLPSRLRRSSYPRSAPLPPRRGAGSSPSLGPPHVRPRSDPTASAPPPAASRPVTALSHRLPSCWFG
jgi:hypothetical protein